MFRFIITDYIVRFLGRAADHSLPSGATVMEE